MASPVPDFEFPTINAPASGGMGEYFTLLGKSALGSATTELVGMDPSEDVARFRAENPVAGFLSELAGMAVPYAGWLKAVEVAKPLSRVKALGTAAEAAAGGRAAAPFLSMAAREATILAPFELGRVGANQLVGDRSFGSAFAEGAVNTVLGGALAGGIEKIRAAGGRSMARSELFRENPGMLTEASPLKLRQLDELRAREQDPARIAAFDNYLSELDATVRTELPAMGQRYVGELTKGSSKEIEGLFRPGTENIVQTRRLAATAADDTFNSPAEWKGIQVEAGLPDTFTRDVQFPRVVQFSKAKDFERAASEALDLENLSRERYYELQARNAKPEEFVKLDTELKALREQAIAPKKAIAAAERTEARIANNLDYVGDGWFIGREKDDGLFVMARKFRGDVGKASDRDSWIAFKTDRPSNFVPQAQRFADAQVAREKWIVGTDQVKKNLGRPGEILTDAEQLVSKIMPRNAYMEQVAKIGTGGVAKTLDNYVPAALKGNAVQRGVSELVKGYFAPAAQQLKKSARGAWTLAAGRAIQDLADTRAQTIMQGIAKVDPQKGLLRPLITGASDSSSRSIEQILEPFRKDPDGWGQLFDLFRQGQVGKTGQQLAARGLIRKDVADAASEIAAINRGLMAEVNRVQEAAGVAKTLWLEGHGGLSRKWDGDIFTAIRDEAGRVVGFGAGNNNRQSIGTAKSLVEKLNAETGRPHRIGETFQRNTSDALPADLRAYITNPGFMMQRGNLRGFKWDLDTPSVDDFLKDYGGDVYRRTRHAANLTREALLSRELSALAVEDPFAHTVVTQRFNQMSGIEGAFSKAQNRIADKILAPVVGRNSATKIVQVTNEALNHLMLGALKLSYPVSNVIGVLQTSVPEVAFLTGAAPERIVQAGYHTFAPLVGSKGAVGTVGFLNPLAIMGKAAGEMRKPDKDLLWGFEQAINGRVIGNRSIEEFTGESAKALGSFRDALKSPGQFWQATRALSQFMPAASERFARAHAYTVGWMTFRDLMGVQSKDQLHRLASQFVARTQYLYSSADRPMVFTSPLGSSMGLFKNWMMNYVATMANYAGEGLVHNNWGPIAWQTASSLAVGGLAATPLSWVADGFTKAVAGKGIMEWTYDEFGGSLGLGSKVPDALTFGLPAALTGISFSSAMSQPGANPVRDAAQIFSIAAWDRAKYVGKAATAAIDHYAVTGEHPGKDPDFRGAMLRAFAPVNLYRSMATDPSTGTVRTISSDLPQIKGMSSTDIYLYRMGLQPLALEKNLKVAEEIYSSKEKAKAATRRFGDAFADAMQAGDSRGMDRLLMQATVQGLDMSAVLRSAATRNTQAQQDVVERLGKPADMARYQAVLAR